MSSDLGSSLENASVAPSTPLDMGRVWNGARRQARILRAVAVAGVAALAFTSFGIYQGLNGSNLNGSPVGPASSMSPEPEPSCYHTEVDSEGEPGAETTMECSSEDEQTDAPCAEIIGTLDNGRGTENVEISIEHGGCPEGQIMIPPSPEPTSRTVQLCVRIREPNGELHEPTRKEQGDCDEGQSELTVERREIGTERCRHSALRPNYLPWARSERPERGRSEDGEAAWLTWSRSEEFPPVYALLSVATSRDAIGGQPTGIFQQGVEGELDVHSGGTMSINWLGDGNTCNHLRLVLALPDGTPAAQVEREIRKIALSLK